MPKEAYFIIGGMILLLIIVAFVSLLRPGGLMSKFAAVTTIGLAIVVLVFGHKQYKKEHTFKGQIAEVGNNVVESVASFFGSGRKRR